MKKWLMAIFILSALLADAAAAAGAALAYFEILDAQAGFMLCASGLALAVIVSIVGTVVLIKGNAKAAALPYILAIIPAAFVVYTLVSSREYPMINDVSTELNYPPSFEFARTLAENTGRDMSFDSKLKETIATYYPDLQPLPMLRGTDGVFGRAMDIARDMDGWTITHIKADARESSFEAVYESPIFHFKDDIIVRVTDAGAGCVVDMRSKSRVGKGDLGANAERIRAFLAQLDPQ